MVLRHEGRLLASSVNPQHEAREWLQRRQPLTSGIQTIFVLGAGSGYHLLELIHATPAQIVVLDYYPEIIAQVRAVHAFPGDRIHFEDLQNAKHLRKAETVREAIKNSFLVLAYPPSLVAQTAFYRDCHKQLLGRDWGSLSWQWQLSGHSCLDQQAKIGSEDLTIYDLENTELVQNLTEREAMLIKALRELVK